MRTRSREESQAKLGILARLKHDVRTARNNAALAAMVDDFSKATNKTSGKTITKVRSFVLCPRSSLLILLYRMASHSWRACPSV